LIFCAASFNAGHAYELGLHHSQFRALVLATASIAAAVLAPLCILAVARGTGFGTRALALMLGAGCILYTSISSLGFVASARDAGISGHVAAVEKHADRRALIEAASKELASLKGQRADVIERRSELTALLIELGKAPQPKGASARPDSQAAALGFYMRAAGWQVSDAAVGTWLNLGIVLFLELAAALSLTVANGLRPMPRQRPVGGPTAVTSPSPVPDAPKPAVGPVRAPAAPTAASRKRGDDKGDGDDQPKPPKPRGGRPVAILPEVALAKLRKGRANGSIRGVAKLLGTSKSTAHRVLHELAGLGMIRLSTSAAGCSIALA
jgi:hypothetical protein